MWKCKALHNHLSSMGFVTKANEHRPSEEPPFTWFHAVHSEDYFRSVLSGSLGDQAERRIGFKTEMRKPHLIKRAVLECSGTVRTVELALQHGVAVNLAGGSHHAHPNFGSGFCIFNDLAVAAAWARRYAGAQRVAILDFDVHQGDGTAAIFANEPNVFTCSMHCSDNFPFDKHASDLDINLPRGVGDKEFLTVMRTHVDDILANFKPDLVLYEAGVDVYRHDLLGHLELTHAGIWQRELDVIGTCVKAGVPIACVIGGGYDRNAEALARRHSLLYRAAAKVWQTCG
jgi:acetoin utilization deacetylase AcuC-like enzyme